jgi:5-methyltetrahydropteroyltriglutamate--homocysteine methyltransferase
VKAVVPGPYTLARLSRIDCGAYRDATALAHSLSEIVTAEVSALAAAGARYIQIDEPAILVHPHDIRLLRRLLEPVWDARGGAQLMLTTAFADAVPLYAELNSLPADILGLDIASSPGLVDVIAATGASKVLALGVIDGRNATCEDPKIIVDGLDRMVRRYALDSLHLMPSCGLTLLSPEQARAKLALLPTVRTLARLESAKAA